MIIDVLPSGPFETNSYLISCPKTEEVALIDPAPKCKDYVVSILENRKLKLKKIFITHSHWDHIGDVAVLKKRYLPSIYVHPLDLPNLEKPGTDKLPCWLSLEGTAADHLVQDQEEITIGTITLKVIHTPGHTPGSICFYSEKEKVIFTGDTLFQGTIGNISFPTSEPEKMWDSLKKLSDLPKETKVYPGHGPPTTIGNENWLKDARQRFGG